MAASRPFKVAVQGAKPRKGERTHRHFKHFESAKAFAIREAGAQWAAGRPWAIENIDTGAWWDAFEDGRIQQVHQGSA